MRRYYLCNLVQDDKGRWVPNIKSAPSLLADQTAAMLIVTSGAFDANGQPTPAWCMVSVEAKDHASLAAIAGVDLLPDFPLDAKVNAMHASTLSDMTSRLTARGVASTLVSNADGYRNVIEGVATQYLNNAGFSADSFNP